MSDASTARGHATIQDVADAAGVSRAAVSKVLRNAYGVSPTMRQRVNAAIESLDYRPRVAARAMRGSTYTIGIEIPDFGNSFFTRVLFGAQSALTGTGYQLMIAPADPGPQEGARALEALLDRQVDGVVAVSPIVDQSSLERIARRTPVVMFGRHDESDFYDTVAADDERGAGELMRHLLELGHTRITHLSIGELGGSVERRTPHGIRLEMYRKEMARAGLVTHERVVRAAEGEEAAYLATVEELDGRERPTAILAGHDAHAIGALRAIMERESDVSVAGFDDIPIASHPGISLTTSRQPGEEMGARAMDMLLERLKGRTEAAHEIFEPSLVVRGSTKPPPP
ncbi:LacI family DNA-binding transcriptional regulator [Microbacterium hominis]|uniref:LacI family DNA-binding transcriptional regulator n=1 Tax=Microbacterium hominis TaxID=162426 RepID=A0A7D4Q9D6_9MICO|nr:LacI family DNA-binding transcriptional regulator [Microbacterium hominis]QKJ20519.1 LacI family DNA-binding transcriptional regulator [Microbacterium hominis]